MAVVAPIVAGVLIAAVVFVVVGVCICAWWFVGYTGSGNVKGKFKR